MLTAWLLSLGCAPNVLGQYEKAREEALSVAADHPAEWAADAALGIATPSLEAAVDTALDAALSSDATAIQVKLPLGLVGRVRPHLEARTVRLKPSDSCSGCFGFDAGLEGTVAWTIGPADGSVPVDVFVSGVVGLDVREGRRVELTPRTLGAVKLSTARGAKVDLDLDGPVQDWVRAAFTDHLPPIRVATLQTDGLPVRELRLRTAATGFVLELLTDVPGTTPLPPVAPPAQGVALSVSPTALVGLARRAAFTAGTLSLDVAADPRAIQLDGGGFHLDLRLWRLTGRGWWRDYDVTGTLGVQGKKIKLVATSARETGQSKGAVLVDPLAALVEGRILDAVVDNLHGALPTSRKGDVAGVGLSAEVWKVEGVGGVLQVAGELEVRASGTR